MKKKSIEKKDSRTKKIEKLVTKQALKERLLELGIEHFTDKTIERIYNCANFLRVVFNFENNGVGSSKIVKANRCKNRFCPVCSATRARKDGYMLNVILKYLKNKFNYSFLFLTLTVPNVESEELVNELDKQYASLKRLLQRKEFKKISKGYIRKTEITYNIKRDDYHPHIHMLIAVDSSYFNSRNFVKRDKWLEIWRECSRNDKITQVDIRKANESSFRELCKYEAKDTDFLMYSQEVFDTFYRALKGRKTLTFNGCFQIAKKKYKNEELNDFKENDDIEYTHISSHAYNYIKSNYKLLFEREMTTKEFQEYNNMKIMEEEIIED